MTPPTDIDPADLPGPILSFLDARTARDTDSALQSFGPDPVVVDDGRTYRGSDEVRTFLHEAGTEFTYTTELVGAQRVDDEHWVVFSRIEGDFPGGAADLAYRFTMDGDDITQLVIAA